MTAQRRELAEYRLEKAFKTLADAKILPLASESTVNRIYYAVFYAAGALLITRGLAASKHSGVLALFSKEFVKTGVMEQKHGKFLYDMFDRRQEGDYRDFVRFDPEEVKTWIKDAEDFITSVSKQLK